MTNRSPNNASFFTDTMPMLPRGGSYALFDALVRYLQENSSAAADSDMEAIVDTFEIEGFICKDLGLSPEDALTSSQIEEQISRIKEVYFLEEARYERYYAEIISFEDLERRVEETINLGEEGVSISEAAKNFVSSIYGIRGELNEVVDQKGLERRNRVSMAKDSVEMLSRAKALSKALSINGITLDQENTLEGAIGRVCKEVEEAFSAEIDDLSVLPMRERIEVIGAAVKKYAIAFSDIKKGNELSDFAQKLKDSNDIDIINSLPALRGLTNPGLDFLQRIVSHLKKALLDEETRRRSSGKVKVKGQKRKEPVSQDKAAKNDLRDLLIRILSASGVEVNANSKSLFIGQMDFENMGMGLDKGMVTSPLNMTISAEGENLKILKLLADLSQIDEDSILFAVNSRPQERLEELQKKVQLAKISGSKTDKFEREVDQIRKIQRDFVSFMEKHGEYMIDFVEEEFVKMLNYSIYAYETDSRVKAGARMNLREAYSPQNAKPYFPDIDRAVDVLDALMALRDNARVLSAGVPELSKEQMFEVRKFLKNPSVSGLAMGHGALEALVEHSESIMGSIERLIVETAPKKKGNAKSVKR